jgi:hypothetical protein
VEGLAQSVQILQEENLLNEAQRERDFSNREHEEHFVTAPNTPSVSDPKSDERRSRELDEQMVALEFDGARNDAAPITPIALLNCLNDAHMEGNKNNHLCSVYVEISAVRVFNALHSIKILLFLVYSYLRAMVSVRAFRTYRNQKERSII